MQERTRQNFATRLELVTFVHERWKEIDKAFWTSLDEKLRTKKGYARGHWRTMYNRWGPQPSKSKPGAEAR